MVNFNSLSVATYANHLTFAPTRFLFLLVEEYPSSSGSMVVRRHSATLTTLATSMINEYKYRKMHTGPVAEADRDNDEDYFVCDRARGYDNLWRYIISWQGVAHGSLIWWIMTDYYAYTPIQRLHERDLYMCRADDARGKLCQALLG